MRAEMGTYSANIITALGALNNQRNKVMLLGDSKEASDNVIEGSNATGLWAGSALAAIDARRQVDTFITCGSSTSN